eukprot:CAMPEP_0175808224 /NCGR_PEP_ID=MMETSP0107_2-20121207/2141_1 /TAXON_ID=195067 ORGANISM="Goniomonas pacifica, Strain CCMP1869" /NCGR_SAMPLE_ID=MMETSP0107_2 /ASSEMBLY_ACC=CAM_ASM_000203 /LENGTH=39 /DNA_ID= /DNA_START= /DNA_END= /DNA_ORIENTATION=
MAQAAMGSAVVADVKTSYAVGVVRVRGSIAAQSSGSKLG